MRRESTSTIVRFGALPLVISGGGAVFLATLIHGQDGPAITLDQIEQAWHRRAERFDSGRISWTVRKFTARGAKSAEVAASPFGDPSRDSKAAPAEDTRHEYTCELTFQGSKVRFETTAPGWWIPDAQFTPQRQLMAYDGDVGTSLTTAPEVSDPSSMGLIRPDDMSLAGIAVAKPLLEFYWPEWGSIEDLKKYSLTSRREVVDGVKCVVLTRRMRTGLLRSLWLDADAGFIVRKRMNQYKNVVRSRQEIGYSADPEHGLVPDGWKSAEYGDSGVLRGSEVAEVTSIDINLRLDDTFFRIEFPPHTLVHDLTDTSGDSDRGTNYLVLENGQKRPVTEGELRRTGVTAEELASTRPGKAGLPRARSGTYWIWAASIAIVLIVCGTVIGRRWLAK
jgi:hypothetical protein